jgi:anti-sigma regulatory factor (Ser/Thr protein kinase)
MRIALRAISSPFRKDADRPSARSDDSTGVARPSDLTPVPQATRRRVWTVEVPGVAESVPLLRMWVRTVLAGRLDLLQAVELIASEYGTNALWHSASGAPGGRIAVELSLGSEHVRLAVLDDGPTSVLNESRPANLADHGRGLGLAAAYADEHGHHDTPHGRLSWALVKG